MPSDQAGGNVCACGDGHYCESEVKELLELLWRLIGKTDFETSKQIDDLLRKYDSHYHTRRVRESGNHAS